jgi:Uma2 family endonuclease
MVTARTRPWPTYEDYLNIPGDDRYELINGEFILVSAPNRAHQIASVKLVSRMDPFVEGRELGWVFHAPFEVALADPEGINIIQPDIIFVSREREHIITRSNIQGAPDLIVEILSPSTGRRDRTAKLDLYARHGVGEYWLADPDTQTVTVMLLKDGKYEVVGNYGIEDTLTSPTLEGFSVNLDSIFR